MRGCNGKEKKLGFLLDKIFVGFLWGCNDKFWILVGGMNDIFMDFHWRIIMDEILWISIGGTIMDEKIWIFVSSCYG